MTVSAVVFGLLTLTTLHGQAVARTGTTGIPELPRKCIKPKQRAVKAFEFFNPLACLEPVVNVSVANGNQAESFVNVNPTNPNNIVVTTTVVPADRRPGIRLVTCSSSTSTTALTKLT